MFHPRRCQPWRVRGHKPRLTSHSRTCARQGKHVRSAILAPFGDLRRARVYARILTLCIRCYNDSVSLPYKPQIAVIARRQCSSGGEAIPSRLPKFSLYSGLLREERPRNDGCTVEKIRQDRFENRLFFVAKEK